MGRHKFVVLSLMAVALGSSFWFLLDVLGLATHRAPTFGVEQFENRFHDFPKTEPNTVFGYASDARPNDPSGLFEFHLTQYTLAPAIIKPTVDENLVIVNYHAKQLDPRLLRANHLVPYKDLGNGIALCKRAPR
ncbi:MAG: hypothetical protein ACLPWF_25290 [Bryobacteraceae bacterium]